MLCKHLTQLDNLKLSSAHVEMKSGVWTLVFLACLEVLIKCARDRVAFNYPLQQTLTSPYLR